MRVEIFDWSNGLRNQAYEWCENNLGSHYSRWYIERDHDNDDMFTYPFVDGVEDADFFEFYDPADATAFMLVFGCKCE